MKPVRQANTNLPLPARTDPRGRTIATMVSETNGATTIPQPIDFCRTPVVMTVYQPS